MKYTALLLSCCLALTASLRAQDPPDAKRKQQPPPSSGVTEEGNADEAAAQKSGDVPGTDLDVKGRPTGRTDLPRFCDLIGAVRPSPLPPGTTGTFCVIAILKGDGVITDASSLKLEYERQQGPMQLGEPTLSAPRPGKLAHAFQGRPVYEDTLVASIPVSVPAGLHYGNYAVQANVSVTLTQGSNGTPIGEMKTLVNAALNVGPTSPLLAVPQTGAQPQAAAANSATQAAGPKDKAAHNQVVEPAPRPQPTAQVLQPTAPPSQGSSDASLPAGDQPPIEHEGGISLLFVVGVGFVVLVGLALLLARKK